MEGRTVILVSHHVKLCAPGAAYVVSLDNGTVAYSGPASHFIEAGLDEQASQTDTAAVDEAEDDLIEDIAKLDEKDGLSEDTVEPAEKKAAPRKLIEDEKRATGSVNRDVWLMYLRA
jgi:ABC-type multidrug transport system ATPase subunit